jgi:hypothetical protein
MWCHEFPSKLVQLVRQDHTTIQSKTHHVTVELIDSESGGSQRSEPIINPLMANDGTTETRASRVPRMVFFQREQTDFGVAAHPTNLTLTAKMAKFTQEKERDHQFFG